MLLGQPFVSQAIDRLVSERVYPALCALVGPARTGKRVAAREMIRRFLCGLEGSETCSCCDCQLVRSDQHERVWVETEPLGIDRARLIYDWTLRLADGRKFVLVPRFDLASSAACEALLKALEEPAGRTSWIVSSRKELSPTIRSRSWTLRFSHLDRQTLEILANRSLNDVELTYLGGRNLEARDRFSTLIWAVLGMDDEFELPRVEKDILRIDIEFAAAMVAGARRKRSDRFGAFVFERLDDKQASKFIDVFERAYRMLDTVRPALVVEWLRVEIGELR